MQSFLAAAMKEEIDMQNVNLLPGERVICWCVSLCVHLCQVIMWKYEYWASVMNAIMGQPESGGMLGDVR